MNDKTSQDEEPFCEGFEARRIGQPYTACPYPGDGDDNTEWLNGWRECDEDTSVKKKRHART